MLFQIDQILLFFYIEILEIKKKFYKYEHVNNFNVVIALTILSAVCSRSSTYKLRSLHNILYYYIRIYILISSRYNDFSRLL